MVLLLGSVAAREAVAQPRFELLLSGLSDPIFLTAAPADTRLFIVERDGRILVYDDGSGLRAAPFLDIRARVSTGGEQGLLGLAFPSDYAASGLFYVYYTNLAGNSVVARFRSSPSDPDLADAASEEPLLVVPQPFTNHQGGTIAFSPIDGYLYFGLGDGGSGNDPDERAQDPQSLLGKMLRIDVSGGLGSGYSIPATNPFRGLADPLNAVRDEIWAFGLRNPFRFGFDRLTGDLFIGDVGQSRVEEIDFEPAGVGGRNYGWDVLEGSLPNPTDPAPALDSHAPVHTPPIHEYDHSLGCSVTGGTVYRGSIAALQGLYFFSDWCSASLWTLDPTTGTVTDRTAELTPSSGPPISQPVAFGEAASGELYVVGLLGNVWRLTGPPDPNDLDGDGLDNDIDPCTVVSGGPAPLTPPSQRMRGSVISISGLETGAGDDRLSVRGDFNPASAVGIDPSTRGVHLRLEDSVGVLVDLDVPGGSVGSPGSCGSRDGWRLTTAGSGPRWSYRNASGALPASGCAPGSAGGLLSITLGDRRGARPQAFQLSVSLSKGTLPHVPAFPVTWMQMDLALAQRVDPGAGLVSAEAIAGKCAEARFEGEPVSTVSVPRSRGGPLPFCRRQPSQGVLKRLTCDGL
jgi:hypothetical protein